MLKDRSTPLTRLVLVFALSTILSVSPAAISARSPASPPELAALQPGEGLVLYPRIPVNIVFVGYAPGPAPWEINPPLFDQILPATSVPVVYGDPFFQKNIAQYLVYPILYQYDYNLMFADEAFEDAFFSFLADASVAADLSVAQELYNEQQARSLTVTDNHWIDAKAVETWLAQHAGPMLGVDTTAYTLFLVNWASRDDFKHHVYVRTDIVSPDTGLNPCLVDERCRFIAWGGSANLGLSEPHRIWFLDLSAGPDTRSASWNIDDVEVPEPRLATQQNGIMDYRIPPIWEYGNLSGYRPFTSVTYDLALVTRVVAINLLFTNDPLYPAGLPAREYLPGEIEIDINILQFDPGTDAETTLDPDVVVTQLQALQPYNSFSWERNFHEPSRRLRDVFSTYLESFSDPTIRSSYGYRDPRSPFVGATRDLITYFENHMHQYLEGEPAYELPVFSFALPDPTPEQLYPYIGFAPSLSADHVVQHFVASFFYPSMLELFGRGQTDIVTHEIGHHLGLSHAHDGVDAEWGLLYTADDAFYFAWLGGQSNSVMSYFSLYDGGFSRFDLDNMSRWMTWEHLAFANHLAGRILESPRASEVFGSLLQADQNAGLALVSFYVMAYEEAAQYAVAASQGLREAAELINVVVDPGGSPGVWGTRGMGRSPFLRQFANDLRGTPASLDLNRLPPARDLERLLTSPE